MMQILFVLNACLFHGTLCLGMEETSRESNFSIASVTSNPSERTDSSSKTAATTNQFSQAGDGDSKNSSSANGETAFGTSVPEAGTSFIFTINESTAKYSPKGTFVTTGATVSGFVEKDSSWQQQTGLDTTKDKLQTTTPKVPSYIEQTGLVFRVNIQACRKAQTWGNITASEGIFELSNISIGDVYCVWFLTAPKGTFITLGFDAYHLGDTPLCRDPPKFILYIYDEGQLADMPRICGTTGLLPPTLYSFTNRLRFSLLNDSYTPGITDALAIRFRFNVTSENPRAGLVVVNTSSTSGYVASPGFDGRTEYPHNFQGFKTIVRPPGHVIMISFARLDIEKKKRCYNDYLKLIKVSSSGESEVWTKCGPEDIPPRVFNSSVRLEFATASTIVKTGFKMLFSFHPFKDTPKELEAGVFNCSVSFYDSFKDHVHCNLRKECHTGEDEKACPYTTENCRDGLVDGGSKCYRFENQNKNVTWNEAFAVCKGYNEVLVTLKTAQEWTNLQKVLDYGRRSTPTYIGLYTSSTFDLIYQRVLQWADGNMAYYVQLFQPDETTQAPMCCIVDAGVPKLLSFTDCNTKNPAQFVCESSKKGTQVDHKSHTVFPSLTDKDTPQSVMKVSFVKCANKEMSIDFLPCPYENKCHVRRYSSFCEILDKEIVPMFECADNTQIIPYTFVCDHMDDCSDGSDERFCEFPECRQYKCRNEQCVSINQRCDGVQHCLDRSDEDCPVSLASMKSTAPPPGIVSLAAGNTYEITPLDASGVCPNTHFRCSEDDYCLPVYLRCNGVYDCVNREDEINCKTYACPGFYRCYSSTVCLHPAHVCDGVFQCPQQDDESFCRLSCPEDSCNCQGLAFICTQPFDVRAYTDVRYLDVSGTGITPESVQGNIYLVSLILKNCRLRSLSDVALPNLQILDLGNNLLSSVRMSIVLDLVNLRYLSLAGNPLTSLVKADSSTMHRNLREIDLSFSHLQSYDGESLQNFPNIKYFNISHSPLRVLMEGAYNETPYIESLDMTGCPVESFAENVLKDLKELSVVYSLNYKLCCRATVPEHFDLRNCFTTMDEISSCEDLLQSNLYRIFLWVFSFLALVGNAGSFVSRLHLNNQASYSIFVMNLNIADFVMGVYLAIVGVADQVYRGNYLWHDTKWKTSPFCNVAGFLCLLSTEVSAFIICLITLDRFLVMRFPFSTARFGRDSAILACFIAWCSGVSLAAVPLLPITSDWQFYNQTGICAPLPITRKSFKGHTYSFGIVIVMNFFLFLVVSVGQIFIYRAVRANSFSKSFNTSTADLSVARRLTTVVLSNFLCLFPIFCLGLLSATGAPIPGEVNVAMAIFALPLNSALNPFLYTLNTVLEKRKKAKEEHLLKRLKLHINTELQGKGTVFTLPDSQGFKTKKSGVTSPKEYVLNQMEIWLVEKVFTPGDVMKHIKSHFKDVK